MTLVLKTSPLRSRYAGSLIENYTAFEAMMKEEVLMSKNEDYYVYLYSMFCIRTKKRTFTHSAVQNFVLFENNSPIDHFSSSMLKFSCFFR